MNTTIRIILILCSFLALVFFIKKIKQSSLKMNNAVTWIFEAIILLLMSVLPDVIVYFSNMLGFISPPNFVFLVIIAFLLIQLMFQYFISFWRHLLQLVN